MRISYAVAVDEFPARPSRIMREEVHGQRVAPAPDEAVPGRRMDQVARKLTDDDLEVVVGSEVLPARIDGDPLDLATLVTAREFPRDRFALLLVVEIGQVDIAVL